MIQFAHKRANNNFNDIVAQLYQQEFKMQEKEKYEHIRQAKEKAIEEQRISEENKRRVEAEKQAESDRVSREHDKTTEQPDTEGRKKLAMKMKMREVYQTQQLVTLLEVIGLV